MVGVSRSLDDVVGMLNTSLSDYLDSVCSADISEHIDGLVSFFRSGGDILITYSGMYVSPTNYLFLLLRSLTNINAYAIEPEAITYYVAPYCEVGARKVLIINSGGDAALVRILDQLTLTGYEVMLVSFTPLANAVKAKVRDDMLTLFLTDDLLQQHLLIGMAVAEFLNRSGVRGYRLWYELNNLKPVLKDLVSVYVGKLLEVREFAKEPFMVTYTPSMLGPAEYITYRYNLSMPRYLIQLNTVKHFIRYVRKVLLISTDVEEFSIKEVRGLKLSGVADVCELRIRTDPLTAPVYGLILATALNMLGGLNG